MKYQLALLASGALVLMAADVWNSKPYTDWSDKDLQKITTDSPWAKKTSVMGTEGPAPPPMGGPVEAEDAVEDAAVAAEAPTTLLRIRLARMVRPAVPERPSAAALHLLR